MLQDRVKKLISGLMLIGILTACGEDGGPQTIVSNNLFLKPSNQNIEKDLTPSLLGLWESEDYKIEGETYNVDGESHQIDDVTYRIRWEVSSTGTTLAKRCTDDKGRHWYSQVSLSYGGSVKLSSTSNINLYNIPVENDKKVSDVALMTGNRPCRVAMNPNNMSTLSLVASDAKQYSIENDDFTTGQIILKTEGVPGEILLKKIQNR